MRIKSLFTALALLAMLNLTAFAGQSNPPLGRKVMMLSSAVAQGDVLAEAARDDVTVIPYETKTTTLNDLVSKVREQLNGDMASSIAFVNHDFGENKFYLTKSETISLGSSLNSKEQQNFWKKMGSLVHPDGRIDLLACNLAKGDQGGMLISTLEELTSRNVAASDDKTGNPGESTDWILESDAINVGECYFTSCRLKKFTGELISSDKKLLDPNGSGTYFGDSVSIFGDTALVGAWGHGYWGINSGTVFFFVRDGDGTWTMTQELVPNDGDEGNRFGYSVSLYSGIAVVGAPLNGEYGYMGGSGSAYVYTRKAGGEWSLSKKLKASDEGSRDYFGNSVSVSGGGILVGAPYNDDMGINSGSVYVFTGSWSSGVFGGISQQAKLTAIDGAEGDLFGYSVSIFGNTALIGAPNDDDKGNDSGSAYVFVRDFDNIWTLQGKLTADDGAEGDNFSYGGVSLNRDTALIGAPYDDDNGNDSGSAYVFVRSETAWIQQEKLKADDAEAGDHFGTSVSLSDNVALVGASMDDDTANNAGSAYLFIRDDDQQWGQRPKLTAADAAADDRFGAGVCVFGDTILVGARTTDWSGKTGAAYVFELHEAELEYPIALGANLTPSPSVGDIVQLTGINSYVIGRGSERLTYFWTCLDSPKNSNPSLSAADSMEPRFVPTMPGRYVFRLRVDNGIVADHTNVLVIVESSNLPPEILSEATASPADITVGEATILSVVAADPEGDVLVYSWHKVSGSGDVTFTQLDSDFTEAVFSEAGEYRLEVTISDGISEVSSSVTVRVNENTEPTISITSHEDNQEVFSFENIVVTVAAGDNSGIQKVHLWSKEATAATWTWHGAVTADPYEWNLGQLPIGSYTLATKAIANDGETVNAEITITVIPGTTEPTVAITAPSDGEHISASQDVIVKIQALDDSGIQRVRLWSKEEDATSWTYHGADTATPYEWNLGQLPVGIYILSTKADTNDGASATKVITITVE